jgi:hypothetical protein
VVIIDRRSVVQTADAWGLFVTGEVT